MPRGLGGVDQADLAFAGVSECAALAPEKLGFQKAGWYRGAIQFDERAIAARTFEMAPSGHQLLAASGLASDENGRWWAAVGHLHLDRTANAGLEVNHRRALAKQLVKPASGPGMVVGDLHPHTTVGNQFVEHAPELDKYHWFGDEVGGTGLHRLHRELYVGVPCHHDHPQLWISCPQL